ncbi:MAG: ABC transporter permease [Chloroflexi bacterium]|nr:ABC transporter permease [Chloroflexota bacterium]
MLKFVLKRLLQFIPVLIGTTLLTFILLQIVPGDPITRMMREHIDPDVVARVRAQMHLDDPPVQRYLLYMWDVLHGNFGESYKVRRDVSVLLLDAFPKTMALTLAALLFAWGIGIPAGIIAALKHYSSPDFFVTIFALLGVSVPVFWSALIFQLVFGWKLDLLPISGYGTIQHLIMPGIVLGWSSAAIIARLTRSSLLEVMSSDYIRTARAKGLRQWKIILRHALKNSLLPVVTIMAIQVSGLLSGAVITESVFGIPGVGRVSVGAIQNRDLPLLQGSVILTVVLVVLGNLIADLSYAFLDPRIRYE